MIYIYTFGLDTLNVPGAKPIELGASSRTTFLYELKDNSGDNISDQNEYFGELSGMYWVWKNCLEYKALDVIGFFHYNKGLCISENKAEKILKKGTQWIVMPPIKPRNHPVPDEVQAIEAILKNDYPMYFKVWNEFYDNEGAGRCAVTYGNNMFITTYTEFTAYCEWLFDILFKMRKVVGDKPWVEKGMRRYCAYMATRLLSVYLKVNNKSVKIVKIRYKNWWLPLVRKMRDLFHINRDSYIYKKLRNKFGIKSSYTK